jgi:ribose transport system ATP-binding protein
MGEVRQRRRLLEVREVWKSFGGRPVLSGVDIGVASGEIRGLVGMNGSGKSTLVKILAGVLTPDRPASMRLEDRSFELPIGPAVTYEAGLGFVHQDLALIERRPVIENLVFGRPPLRKRFGLVDWKAEIERALPTLERVGLRCDPRELVGRLSSSDKSLVSIARALDDGGGKHPPKVLILDEPTVGLPAEETERVLAALGEIARSGTATILISHSLADVMSICETVTVLRDGRVVLDGAIADQSHHDLIAAMSGSDNHSVLTAIPQKSGDDAAGGGPAQEVLGLVGMDVAAEGRRITDLHLTVGEGEIVGLAGDQNSGTRYVLEAIYGDRTASWHSLRIDGSSHEAMDPGRARKAGLAYIPQDRMGGACFPGLTVRENLLAGDSRDGGPLRLRKHRRERASTRRLMIEFGVRPVDSELKVEQLSGGNQQKVAVARVLSSGARLILLDEPSQGLDVLARRQVMEAVVGAAAERLIAFLTASSDLDFLTEICSRIYVLHKGQIVSELSGDSMTPAEIRRAMTAFSVRSLAAAEE